MAVPPLSPPLVGRTGEQALLADLAGAAAAGSGRVVLVEGEAGIGKSRLIAEAVGSADYVRQHWWGRAEEDDERPFAALADALGCRRSATEPARWKIAHLLAGEDAPDDAPLQPAQAPELRFRVLEAILDMIEILLRSGGPAVLVLDDLQWADEGTLLALRHVGRRLRSLPLLVVGAYRPLPMDSALDRTIASLTANGAATVPLGPLGSAAVAQLAEEMHGAPAGESLLRALEGAAGNPLFVVELAGAAAAAGAVEIVEGRAELRTPCLPPPFRVLIRRRLHGLPADALDLLRLAAVIGSSFAVADLCQILGRRAVDLLGPLDRCLQAGLLRDDGDGLGFRHDLIREAICQDMPADLQRELHRDIGLALAAADGPTLRAAHHLLRGARSGDDDAVRWLHDAAKHAAPVAPVVALGLLDRALELAPCDDPSRALMEVERVRSLLWAGRLAEGRDLAERLVAAGGSPEVAGLREALAMAFLLEGRLVDVVDQLDRATADPSFPAARRAHLQAEAALGRLAMGQIDRATAQAEEARQTGEELGDDIATCLALCTLSWVAHSRGDLPSALALAEEAVLLSSPDGSPTARYGPHFFYGVVLSTADRLDDAAKAFAVGRDQCEPSGNLATLPIHHCGIAMHRLLAGEWDDAVAEVEAGLAVSEEVGTRLAVVWLHGLRAHIAIHRGELDAAREAAAQAEAEILQSGPQFGVDWLMWARALLVEDDDPAQALAILENAWWLYEALGAVTHCHSLGPDVVRLAVATGRVDLAASVTARIAAVGEQLGTDSAVGTALRCQGLVEDDVDLLLAAVAAVRAGPRPYELAVACEDAATALARGGRRHEASALAREALAIHDRLGACRDAARAASTFRAAGLRLGRRGRRGRPATGWDSLTTSERRVSELVAQGLTNREIGQRLFVSPRTVETHLAHVYAKLGLPSRSALAAEVATRATAVE